MNDHLAVIAAISNNVASMGPPLWLRILDNNVVARVELPAAGWPFLVGFDLLAATSHSLTMLRQVAAHIGGDAITDGSAEQQLSR